METSRPLTPPDLQTTPPDPSRDLPDPQKHPPRRLRGRGQPPAQSSPEQPASPEHLGTCLISALAGFFPLLPRPRPAPPYRSPCASPTVHSALRGLVRVPRVEAVSAWAACPRRLLHGVGNGIRSRRRRPGQFVTPLGTFTERDHQHGRCLLHEKKPRQRPARPRERGETVVQEPPGRRKESAADWPDRPAGSPSGRVAKREKTTLGRQRRKGAHADAASSSATSAGTVRSGVSVGRVSVNGPHANSPRETGRVASWA